MPFFRHWLVLSSLLALASCSPPADSAQGELDAINASTGELPRDVIEKGLRAKSKDVQACYDAGLKRDPKLEGSVKTSIMIGPKGKVDRVVDAGSSLPDKSVLSCVRDVYKGVVFPPPKGGAVIVVYPLEFGAAP